MLRASILLLTWAGLSQSEDGCRRCDHRGVSACPAHSRQALELEERVLFCALAAACETCAGVLLVDCEHCDSGPDSALIEERGRGLQEYRARTPLEERLERSLPRIETEHFQLVIDTGTVKQKRKKIDAHELSHQIADDVERVAQMIAVHFGIASEDRGAKSRMWIWKDPADHAEVMPRFLGTDAKGDFKMLGKNPVFSVWTEKPFFDGALEIRSLFAHQSAHMLLSNHIAPLWFGDLTGGWLDAGAGHWYEYELFGRTTHYCIEEATVPENWSNGVWRAAIRDRLTEANGPLLPTILDQNTGAMKQSDQALCWSFYDFLIAKHPQAARPILEDLKEQKPVRDIFKERLGLDVLGADAAWRDWVKEVYPTRGDTPRQAGKKRRRGK